MATASAAARVLLFAVKYIGLISAAGPVAESHEGVGLDP
jgi:hypothetical protein